MESGKHLNAPLLLGVTFLALFWLERRRPLRKRTGPPLRRLAANAGAGALAGVAAVLPSTPFTQAAGRLVERHRIGLVPRLGLPPWGERVAALLLMDYTLYLWHILLHRAPFLWRSHRRHHLDTDLDVSTALRFHVGEMAWSLPWRMAQVLLIGVPRRTLKLWGALTLAEVMFHHANLRLPPRLERILGLLVMTPAQHGVHHSNRPEHQHSNFSSGLTVWDYLHGTHGPAPPQRTLVMGVPPQELADQRTSSENP